MSTIRQLLRSLRQKCLRALRLELVLHLRLDLLKRRSLRSLDLGDLVNRESLRRLRHGRRVVLLGREQRVRQFLRGPHSRKRFRLRQQFGRGDRQTLVSRSLVHASRTRQALHGIGQALCGRRGFLLLDRRLDLRLHFVKRLDAGVLLVFHADDVESIAGADDVGRLALGRSECRLLEFRNGTPLGDRRQQPTILRAARIVGILLRQLLEIDAGLQLLLDILGLRLGCFHALGIDLAVRVRGWES